jgi:hypothetical protein
MSALRDKQADTPGVSTKRSVAEWVGAQRRSVAAVLARAAKKILPEAQQGVEIFLSRLYTLASMFDRISE